ncbi:MAG: bifunctional 4-hydroxy-2-oxoglutarate aldolase/2-dehydro-3-deoxy-phosphogluconate aldolase [Spirochaetaceae bacterium]|nr:MAG: bifunctional 4-hydroxy-2-oxoglutarate aldolase/2-dehydro-3-deoxy-phosphogluconate aldolase [Spirochaetaceae bacterium]
MSNSALEKITATGIVPVVTIDSPEKVIGLGKALHIADISIAEITFRTAAAAESIRRLNKEMPEILVGAGTIVNINQAKQAIEAGAQFIVSPGYSDDIVKFCRDNDILVVPGVTTPTEVQYGLSQNVEIFKLFPAEISGGVKMLDALKGPFPQAKFIPTGGINQNNAADYIRRPNVLAVGGSWMVPPDLVSIEDWDSITRLGQLAVAAIAQ